MDQDQNSGIPSSQEIDLNVSGELDQLLPEGSKRLGPFQVG